MQKQNIPFIDLDQYIEKQENTSIRQLFEEKGELSFRKRKIERQVLTHLLESKSRRLLHLVEVRLVILIIWKKL